MVAGAEIPEIAQKLLGFWMPSLLADSCCVRLSGVLIPMLVDYEEHLSHVGTTKSPRAQKRPSRHVEKLLLAKVKLVSFTSASRA
eukprot:1022526-Amphidinium_carterae.1